MACHEGLEAASGALAPAEANSVLIAEWPVGQRRLECAHASFAVAAVRFALLAVARVQSLRRGPPGPDRPPPEATLDLAGTHVAAVGP